MSEEEIKNYLSEIGRKGGKRRSALKCKALKISLAKARRVRELQFLERAHKHQTKKETSENNNTKQGKKRSRDNRD